ncbi:MAG: DUF4321 domain-containing protein [Caloramator sp.]|nr:DUF4321 domain-containing protein [Caloramator sp.]
MGKYNYRGIGYLIILLLIFGLAGTMFGEILGSSIRQLSALQKSYYIGLNKPIFLDLKVLTLTFALSFKINILTIIGMIIGFFLYKKM